MNKRFVDVLMLLFPVALAALLFFFVEDFIRLTGQHPYWMGFFKVALLATWGECLKMRLTRRTWKISKPISRFVVWGLFGIWFAFAFKGFPSFISALVQANMWPDGSKLWIALSTSLSINILGGYAYTMMLGHEYFNKAISRGKPISLTMFAEGMQGEEASLNWFRFIPKTIVYFWLPAHTITFLMPGYYRVLFAASLSVALGFLLTLTKRK